MELNRVAVGRLNLGGTLDTPGAVMQLRADDGSLLASGTANQNGYVFFRNVYLPDHFRAVATLPNSSTEFCADIRGYRQNNKHARVSVLTTLACRYRDANPSLGIDQAETRVKQLLALPQAVDLSIAPQGINPFFSEVAFFRAASQTGGLDALYNQLMALEARAQSPTSVAPSRSFLLSKDQLDRPLPGGLEPALTSAAEQIRLEQAQRLGVEPASNAELSIRYTPSISLLEGPTSLGGQFLLGIGTGLGGNLLTDGVGAVFGWAANQMGLAYGTGGQLTEIEGELNALTNLVSQFKAEYTTSSLTTTYDTINGFFDSSTAGGADVVDDSGNLLAALNSPSAQIAVPPAPVSFSSSSAIVGLNNTIRANLAQNNYNSALNEAKNNLLGNTQFLKTYGNTLNSDALGFDTPSGYQGLPWRNNSVLQPTIAMYQQFAQLQVQTLNLMAEAAHSYPNNPTTALSAILKDIQSGLSSLKQQRQQLPLYASQNGVIVDLENGIMWREAMANPDTYSNAVDAMAGEQTQLIFPDGSAQTYSNFHLPTIGECESLQNRGRFNPSPGDPNFTGTDTSNTLNGVPVNSKNGTGDTGQSTAGLPRLGFTNVATALSANQSQNDNGQNGDMWMSNYEYDNAQSGSAQLEGNWEFRLNHSSSNTSKENNSNDQNVYVACCTFGPVVLVNPYTNLADSNFSEVLTPSDVAGQDLVPGEIAQFGVPTSMTLSTGPAPTSITYPPTASSGQSQNVVLAIPTGAVEVIADITYSLTLGGNYTMGPSQAAYSTATNNYTGTVSTAANPNNQVNYLGQLIDWSSSDPKSMQMLNLPFTGGIGYPRSTNAVTITATLLGASNAVTPGGSLAFTPAAPLAKTLTSIQITPRNVTLGGPSFRPASGSLDMFCTGFYSDGTLEDLSTVVTWTVPPNISNAQVVVAGGAASFSLTTPGQTTIVPYNLDITASYQGFTDTTTFQIVPPAASN